MLALTKALAWTVLAAVASTACAETYYVSPKGDDKGAGDAKNPWRTLRHGLTSLQPGDILLVRGGEYLEILGAQSQIDIAPGTKANPITVRAYPGERPVLRGLLWLTQPSYWTLDGINVTWQDGQSSRSHMVKLTNGIGWTFKNAEVWGAHSYANILVAGTKKNEPDQWLISGCDIHDTYASNKKNQDHLIYVNTGLDAGSGVIEGNKLKNAPNGNGVKLGGAGETSGTVNVTVRNNNITDCAQGILVAWRSRNNRICNNYFDRVGKNYGFIRGFELTGEGNEAYDNTGGSAKHFVLNDPGFRGLADRNNRMGRPAPRRSGEP
jgi:hypothetical protein